MRIFYLSQYFPPEIGATQNRAYEMAHQWVILGHAVTMVSEFPNHPSGIMPPEYCGRFIEKCNLDGINVIRVWVKTSPKKSFWNRMFFYFSYMFLSVVVGFFTINRKYDFIYATSPPLFVGAAALALSYLKGIPMIFEVRDLWPESAIEMGELSNAQSIALAKKLEEKCYQKSIAIVVVTNGVFNKLVSRGINKDKLIYIPNGANVGLISFKSVDRNFIRQELELEDKFIIIYAGIHGLAQNLETIIEAARLLQDQKDIHFLLIGEGPKKQELIKLSLSYNQKNITFLPEVPRENISKYLSAADVAVIPLRKNEVFQSAIPSKLYDAWACEKPVIVAIDGEASELVKSIGGGVSIPPEDPRRLAETIQYLNNNKEDLFIIGKKGREYVNQHHSREVLATTLIHRLENLILTKK